MENRPKEATCPKPAYENDISNLAKQVVYEEVLTGTKGLAYECSQICDENGIQDIMGFEKQNDTLTRLSCFNVKTN